MVPSLSGLAPFQIAFIVSDLERAAREFDARLAAGPWRGWLFGPQGQGREYHGDPAEWTLFVEAVEPPARMPRVEFVL